MSEEERLYSEYLEKIKGSKLDMTLAFELRKEVLLPALYLESLISNFLGHILEIDNIEASITLGNKSTTLPLNQKVNLLIDIGAIEGEQRKKFIAFMEIRNQFVHNAAATSYERCFSNLEGKDTWILRTYPQNKELSKEQQLKEATSALANEVLRLTVNITDFIRSNAGKKIAAELHKKILDILIQNINDTFKFFDDTIEEVAKERTAVDINELRGLGKRMKSSLYGKTINAFKAEAEGQNKVVKAAEGKAASKDSKD